MTLQKGQQWVVAARPDGMPVPSDFRLEDCVFAEPGPDKALVRIHYHTVAPGVRAKLAAETYTGQIPIGGVIPSNGVGVVIASNTSSLRVGDLVAGELGWATHMEVSPDAVQVLDPVVFGQADVPLEAAIGVLGVSGLTAYFGLLRIAHAEAGETVLVSSASGAVGSTVGQIARIIGCRVIGIASSKEKCAELKAVFGFDEAIDYRDTSDLRARIEQAAPNGVDVYFDNVGGEIADAAITSMKIFGRVVVCGQTSIYNQVDPRGLKSMTHVITRRLTLRGFVVHDFAHEFAQARGRLKDWLIEGQLVHRPTIRDGIATAVEAFVGQFSGGAAGRPIIKVI